MKYLRWAAVLLLVAGCAGMHGLEPPRVGLADLRVNRVTPFETAFLVQLRVFNTNDEPLHIRGIDCELEVGGNRFATGVSNQAVEIPPYDSGTVDILAYSSVLNIASSLIELARSTGRAESPAPRLGYNISGRLRLGGASGFKRTIPFEAGGEFSLESLTAPARPKDAGS